MSRAHKGRIIFLGTVKVDDDIIVVEQYNGFPMPDEPYVIGRHVPINIYHLRWAKENIGETVWFHEHKGTAWLYVEVVKTIIRTPYLDDK